LYAILNGDLVSFKPETPGTLLSALADAGFSYRTRVIEIDPATGDLYAMYQTTTTSYRLRRINLFTGYASDLRLLDTFATAASSSGIGFGMAYDPLQNALRVITAVGDNLLIGFSTARPTISYSRPVYAVGDVGFGITPYIEHIAYTNTIPTINPPPRTTWAAIRTHLVNYCGMTIAP
jgi:Domain of unknown function (DUF4394)